MNAGHRRAALALSALGKADRTWILQKLSREERLPLTGLLTDLQRQGIKVPASEMEALLHSAPRSDDSGPTTNAALRPLQRLALMRGDQVFRVLWREPDWLVAVVCGIANWRWLPEFLRMLQDQRASQVQQYMRSQVVDNTAACEALVAAVVERVRRGDGEDAFELAYRPLNGRKRPSTLARLTSWLL